MKIDKALNLVCPVDSDNGMVYIHSMPIGREVFERYFMVISKTFAALFSEGLNTVAGPRVAAMLLKKIAIEMGEWDGEAGVEIGLMGEIRRLSNVAIPGPSGWSTVPLNVAVSREFIDQRDVDEAEGAIVFFTCISLMSKRNEAAYFVRMMCELWSTQTTSLSTTAYAASLPMLTATATLPQEAITSSVPL
jgi:hypothetical protein